MLGRCIIPVQYCLYPCTLYSPAAPDVSLHILLLGLWVWLCDRQSYEKLVTA
jgi:hypothetical protein